MYYDEAYQRKGLVGYFPFVEKRNSRIHNYCHSFASGPSGCISGGKFVWKTESSTTELVSNLTAENTITSSFERMNHELKKIMMVMPREALKYLIIELSKVYCLKLEIALKIFTRHTLHDFRATDWVIYTILYRHV